MPNRFKRPGAYVMAPVLESDEMENEEVHDIKAHSMRKKRKQSERSARDTQRSARNGPKKAVLSTVPVAMSLGLLALRRLNAYEPVVSWQAGDTRLSRLEDEWAGFDQAFNEQKCKSMSDAELSAISECFGEGEKIYLALKSQLRSYMEEQRPLAGSSGSAISMIGTAQQSMQLQIAEPALVPKFSGNEEEWANFRDAFKTEVHLNPRYTQAQKLRKLMSSLEGRAKRAIGTWTASDERSYPLAWEALCKIYDNEYRTIQAHLQKIFALKPMSQSSRDSLREVLDTVRGAHRQLRLLLPPEQIADYLFLFQIERTLDSESQAQWGMRRTNVELPTLDQMYDFLELRSSLMGTLPRNTAIIRSSEGQIRGTAPGEASPTPMFNIGRGNEPKPKCDLCQNRYHWPFACPRFRAMPISERMTYVVRHKMCISCFSTKHETANCPDRQCPRCHVRHNSCLCPQNPNTPKSSAAKSEPSNSAKALQPNLQ